VRALAWLRAQPADSKVRHGDVNHCNRFGHGFKTCL
jgi:hypothetical protein